MTDPRDGPGEAEPDLAGEESSVRVHVQDSVFTVNRASLAQYCQYFRSLFRSGMRECRQGQICLGGLTARGFHAALATGRGERPSLGGDEIVEAVECAAFLQAEGLARHLADIIDSDNCLLLCHAADAYGLWEVRRQAALFARDTYRDLEEQEEFGHLPMELAEYVRSLTPSSYVAVGTHSPSLELLQNAFRTVCYLDEKEGCWKHLTDLPTVASTSLAGLAVLDDRLYIVGGVYGVGKQAVDSAFCYDAVTDTWSRIAGPRQPRYNFMLVGLEGQLYAIGGEYERKVMSSTERYHVSTGTWTFACHAPRPVAGAACALAVGRIFVCFWRPPDTTAIYEYVPSVDAWTLTTTLVRSQSYGHCMVAHRDNLYVMRNGPSDDFLRCLIERYNITSGQWSALPGHYVNSKGALFTAAVRGDSAFTVNRALTLEYAVAGDRWTPRREMRGFPASGSVWTFFLRLGAKAGARAGTAPEEDHVRQPS